MCSVLVAVAVAGWFAALMLWCCLRSGKEAGKEDDHEGVLVSREAKS